MAAMHRIVISIGIAAMMLWLSAGCTSLKQLGSGEQVGAWPIERRFHNQNIDTVERNNLWSVLQYRSDHVNSVNADTVMIRIQDKVLHAYLLRNSVILDSLSIKGRKKQHYFVGKSKNKVIPIPLLYGHIQKKQIQLVVDQYDRLHVDYLDYRWGWVLFFFADTGGIRSFIYKSSP